MKKILSTYFDLNSAERRGIAVLLCLLALLVLARSAMVYIIAPPAPGKRLQNKLTASWEGRKHELAATAAASDTTVNAIININTADSASLLTLEGIGPALTHRILERRRQLGGFKNYGQVWAVYHFSDAVKKELLEKTRLN